MCQASVNLTPCCIKQDNRKNSGGGVGVDRKLKRGCGVNKTSKRWGRKHMGCLHKIGG